MSPVLRVNEVFGPTIQGEGPTAGRPCTFLRLALCNQSCVWCDTAYTWDWSRYERHAEIHPLEVEEVRVRLMLNGLKWTGRLVVSGGEPLMQGRELATLLDVLPQRVEVETAGTIAPTLELARRVDQWNCSPKLVSSGNRLETRRKVDVLRELNRLGAAFKFVVSDLRDFDEVEEIQGLVGVEHERVWIMPEGADHDALRERGRLIVEETIRRGYCLSWRLQVELWGGDRGH